VVTAQALPLNLGIGPGNEHDSRRLVEVVGGIRVKTHAGRPRTRPREVVADTAYDTKEIRRYLRKRGISTNIPANRRNLKRNRRGRPYRLDPKTYRRVRSSVERFFAWLKGGFRRLALRYERLTSTFLGLTHLACIAIYLKVLK